MTIKFIGNTFPISSQWHNDEVVLIQTVQDQIDKTFPTRRNLLISTTWFGPQFENSAYFQLDKLINNVDQLFFLSSVDPVMLNLEQLEKIVNDLQVNDVFYLGNFDSKYQFTFISTLLPKYFKKYDINELLLNEVKHIYTCYNRKPRMHRVELVNKLINYQLDNLGIITLGQDSDKIYSQGICNFQPYTLNEQPDDYAKEGNWGHDMRFGIPHDIHSLGNMDIWQSHFLTVVGETEFFPWDNTFISEKTWKPILGLRPFLINGQVKIYQWLRDHGFRTFNHYWPQVELEDVKEFEVHDSIVAVLKFLSSLDKKQLLDMYQSMLPDLLFNRDRFFEFSKEQSHKIENLFK